MASVSLDVLLVAVHLVTATVCLPMIGRRVPPNGTYGFRTPKTLSNERTWYEANAIAGRWLLGATIASAACAAALFFVLPPFVATVASFGTLTLGLIVATIASLVALARIDL